MLIEREVFRAFPAHKLMQAKAETNMKSVKAAKENRSHAKLK